METDGQCEGKREKRNVQSVKVAWLYRSVEIPDVRG